MFNLPLSRLPPSRRPNSESAQSTTPISPSTASTAAKPGGPRAPPSSYSNSSDSITPTPSGVTTPRPYAIPDPPLFPDSPTRPESQLSLPTHLLRLKSSAQSLYQTRHYNAAIETWCHILLQIPPTTEFAYERSILYSNISAAAIGNKAWETVIESAGRAVDLRPGWGRAWGRLVKGTVGGVIGSASEEVGELKGVERRVEEVLRMPGVRWERDEREGVEGELRRVREILGRKRREREGQETD